MLCPRIIFASNGLQEVDEFHAYHMSNDTKISVVITLYSCDIKTASLPPIHREGFGTRIHSSLTLKKFDT